MRRRLLIVAIFLLAGAALPGGSANGGVMEFTDKDEWISAVGVFTTIDFTGFPDGTFITDQYEALAVLFTDGDDNIACCSEITFPNDGAGLDGNAAIHLSFLTLQNWIAVDFPGVIQLELYRDGRLTHTSAPYGTGIGLFAGLVSNEPVPLAEFRDEPVPIPLVQRNILLEGDVKSMVRVIIDRHVPGDLNAAPTPACGIDVRKQEAGGAHAVCFGSYPAYGVELTAELRFFDLDVGEHRGVVLGGVPPIVAGPSVVAVEEKHMVGVHIPFVGRQVVTVSETLLGHAIFVRCPQRWIGRQHRGCAWPQVGEDQPGQFAAGIGREADLLVKRALCRLTRFL